MSYTADVKGEIRTAQYDEHWGRHGEFVDWITEYEWYSPESISKEKYLDFLKENGHNICGELRFHKYLCTYGNGKTLFKHVLKEVNY